MTPKSINKTLDRLVLYGNIYVYIKLTLCCITDWEQAENPMNKDRTGDLLIARIHQLNGRILARMLKKYGIKEINPAQGRIMYVLWQNDNIPTAELARQTSLGKSTLTSMLDRLEDAGYIKRVRSKEDRRTIFIKRTDKDKAFQEKYIRISEGMSKVFYNGFSSREIDVFENYLRRIYKNLELNI